MHTVFWATGYIPVPEALARRCSRTEQKNTSISFLDSFMKKKKMRYLV